MSKWSTNDRPISWVSNTRRASLWHVARDHILKFNVHYKNYIKYKCPYWQWIHSTDHDLDVQRNLNGDRLVNKSADGQKAGPNTLFPPDRLAS
jgi:hypothetical protein